MFFDSLEKIPEIAKKTGFSIFVVDPNLDLKLKNSFCLSPDEKTKKINVEAVRDFTSMTLSKQSSDQFFIVREPETMNTEAANAFLKNLEEPKENYHFVFLTKNPTALLPTVLSRAQLYLLKQNQDFTSKIEVSEEVKNLAKRLMTARDRDLPGLAKEIATKKDRVFALEIVSTAIEMSYKTFFLTSDPKFLKKLPNLLELYENIAANGHIKLHFVADML